MNNKYLISIYFPGGFVYHIYQFIAEGFQRYLVDISSNKQSAYLDCLCKTFSEAYDHAMGKLDNTLARY